MFVKVKVIIAQSYINKQTIISSGRQRYIVVILGGIVGKKLSEKLFHVGLTRNWKKSQGSMVVVWWAKIEKSEFTNFCIFVEGCRDMQIFLSGKFCNSFA